MTKGKLRKLRHELRCNSIYTAVRIYGAVARDLNKLDAQPIDYLQQRANVRLSHRRRGYSPKMHISITTPASTFYKWREAIIAAPKPTQQDT